MTENLEGMIEKDWLTDRMQFGQWNVLYFVLVSHISLLTAVSLRQFIRIRWHWKRINSFDELNGKRIKKVIFSNLRVHSLKFAVSYPFHEYFLIEIKGNNLSKLIFYFIRTMRQGINQWLTLLFFPCKKIYMTKKNLQK